MSSKPKQQSKKIIQAILILALLLTAGVFGYNKYLDYRNVEDMKQLLADFEQLKQDVEAETGDSFKITADCGSGGPIFGTFYACSLNINPADSIWDESYDGLFIGNASALLSESCILANDSFDIEQEDSFYSCPGINIRNANKSEAEKIFMEYAI